MVVGVVVKRHVALETSDLGSPALAVVVEDIAVGTRGTFRRARRREPWEGIAGLTRGMHQAALTFRQAFEHCAAGMGMGPLPWAADRGRAGSGMFLWQGERAITSADHYRRCVLVMGLTGTHVVTAVVLFGDTLAETDRRMKWRNGTASVQLLAALGAVARKYGVE